MILRLSLFLSLLLALPSLAAFRVGVAARVVTPEPLLPVSGGVGASRAAK
jgi:hypothetical protein